MSRRFVCVRIDSYESEEAQKHVRSLLDGRFENSAFVIIAPDGKEWLTTAGRGPNQVLGGPPTQYPRKVEAMRKIADRYKAKGKSGEAVLQDFHSFGQALNVASADQRILVVLQGEGKAMAGARERLRSIAASGDLIGRFHYDSSPGKDWTKVVTGLEEGAGIHLIVPAAFGLEGTLHRTLPITATADEVRKALLEANAAYAKSEKRKVYREHVSKGRRDGIRIESAVPYGEDRDGDGKIDAPRRGRRR
ncbi:MAG: hypothetical protein VCA38_04585 [Roseibacillus sp.]